jgi:acetyltransferase-like isoleucine patch superfamily enzyme
MNILFSVIGLRKFLLIMQNFFFNLIAPKKFGDKVNIFGFPIIHLVKGSQVRVGKNLVLISSAYFSEPGVNHPVIIRTLNPSAKIIIGDDVGISGGGIIAAEEISIGNGTMLGANVTITDTDFHPIEANNRRYNRQNVQTAKVTIEENVFVGMNSIILKGVRIGRNSVIGAGSVVTKSIPANSIAAGNPARIIGEIHAE